jgi:predicted nucleic-acid-binding protein
MIAIDTNVIVRLLIADNPAQTASAKATVDQNAVFVSSGVLIEAEWVLRALYDIDSKTIAKGLESVLALSNVQVPWPKDIALLFEAFRSGMDFADVVHLMDSSAANCEQFATFDAKLRKRAEKHDFGVDAVVPQRSRP